MHNAESPYANPISKVCLGFSCRTRLYRRTSVLGVTDVPRTEHSLPSLSRSTPVLKISSNTALKIDGICRLLPAGYNSFEQVSSPQSVTLALHGIEVPLLIVLFNGKLLTKVYAFSFKVYSLVYSYLYDTLTLCHVGIPFTKTFCHFVTA